jgi:molybdopterin converting factor small subunit
VRVTVRLFARLRDIAGSAELTREIAQGATIQSVWRELAGEYPALREYERSISSAVNADYARMDAAGFWRINGNRVLLCSIN